MLEWTKVSATTFTNAAGKVTSVKLLHELNVSDSTHFVPTRGRDIDLIAWQELETEAEALNILEVNAQRIVEYDFNMAKVAQVQIP